MANFITALEQEIEVQRQRLHLLEESLARFKQMEAAGASKPVTATVLPGQFQSKPISHAIQEYVSMCGGSAKIADLPQALSAGDAKLGKYPKRSVKLAVLNSPERLELRDGVVYLARSKKA